MSSQFGETNPGSVHQSFGGVGRNIAGMGFFFFLSYSLYAYYFIRNLY